MPRSLPAHWIDQPEQLDALGRTLAAADVIGVDTEQDSFFSYTTKVCVLQIGTAGGEWIIDTLALQDFTPLAAPFLDRAVPKVFHAGENDVDLLRRSCGLEIRGLFDTMVASSVLGYRKTGLAGLLETHFGVTLEKKYQRSDWRKRPLEREQIEYAALDVRYLPELREILRRELIAKARVEEAESSFRRIEQVVHEPRHFDADDYFRLAGARELDGQERRVLRALYVVREEIAAAEDRAVFRVCPDGVLVMMARLAPASTRALERVRGLSDRVRNRYGTRILEAVHGARESGPLAAPRARRDGVGPVRLEPEDRELFDRLRGWRAERARLRDVEPGRVIPNALLMQVVQRRAATPEDLAEAGLESWRIREYGAEILAVVRGHQQAG